MRKTVLSSCIEQSILETVSLVRGTSIQPLFCRNCAAEEWARNSSARSRWPSVIAVRHSMAPLTWTAMGYCPVPPMIPDAKRLAFDMVMNPGFGRLSLSLLYTRPAAARRVRWGFGCAADSGDANPDRHAEHGQVNMKTVANWMPLTSSTTLAGQWHEARCADGSWPAWTGETARYAARCEQLPGAP
jgi:hypothetical protein